MEPQYFTVLRISGDYAELRSDSGIENTVALALLPPDVDEGSRLRWEDFQFYLVER